MKIHPFTFNDFEEKTYVVYDETKNGIIIDPGCYSSFEQDALVKFIESEKITIESLINTHCHIDHVLGNAFVKQQFNCKLIAHKRGVESLQQVKSYAHLYGVTNYEDTKIDEFVEDGDDIKFGNSSFKILYVPGHAQEHIALHCPLQKICISGDVLFRESIGRTDLPGGDYETLINSIRLKIYALADDVTIYPGHGLTTTILHEKQNNPFCRLP